MSLEEYLLQDKERFLSRLQGADGSELIRKEVEREIDRLLYTYNEETQNETMRQAAASMLSAARMSTPLLAAAKNTGIDDPSAHTGKTIRSASKVRWRLAVGMTGLISGVLFLCGSLFPMLYGAALHSMDPRQQLCTLLAGAMLFAGGYLLGSDRSRTGQAYRLTAAEKAGDSLTLDYGKIFRTLQGIVMVADQQLQHIALQEARSARHEVLPGAAAPESGAPDKAQLELIGSLLEAARSGDGQFALDRLSSLTYYLHRQGIETIDYTPAHEDWFDCLPAGRTQTIRPALAKDGQLLLRGVAGV